MHQWLSGAEGHSPETKFQPLAMQSRLDEVMITHGCAAQGHQKVRFCVPRPAQCGFEGGEAVSGNAEIDGFRACLAGKARHRQSIRGDDLVPAGRFSRRHEFVAGGEDRDPRPAANLEGGVTTRGREGKPARIQALPRPQERIAGLEIETGNADMALGRRPFPSP